MSDKKEFADICYLLHEFCSDTKFGSFRSKLKKIGELELKGWEKWLQIEFSMFLHAHTDIVFDTGSREYCYILDQRKANKCKAYADFSFRKKNSSKDLRIVLEFKANPRQTSCVQGMIADCEKIWSVRGSDDDMRSFWVVGFHKFDGKSAEELKENALRLVNEKHEQEVRKSMLECMLIGRSGYALTVF
ncbi:MAG: hypothetical protein KKG98_09235 [Proteobacteria bacterium]|nr:hypothetical protein [Pseudomonadota bacterium]MBU4413347.1 hypothetical protein [Pseudomonadota bacterium]MCG2824516.1 hypothetical protein [Desulfobulbaceae bacterium]